MQIQFAPAHPLPSPANEIRSLRLPTGCEFVRRLKIAPNYLEATRETLGVFGPDSADEDPATLTPEIPLRSGVGKGEDIWNKGGQEGVEIQKDSGSGQWTFRALDIRPDYIDAIPVATSKYRAIYSTDAQRSGQWRNAASITVGKLKYRLC